MNLKHNPFTLIVVTLLLLGGLACSMGAKLLALETPTILPPANTPVPPSPSPTSLPPTPRVICADVMAGILSSAAPDQSGTGDLRGKPDDTKAELYTLAVYSITDDKITWLRNEPVPESLIEFQDNKDAHQQVWDYFVKLIPQKRRTKLDNFVIISDGENNLLAAVRRTDEDPNSWILQVDIADTKNARDLTYTLIHEFAHLLTLGPSQVTQPGCIR
ncbi:MAG: hypothetical protein HZB19_16680 [Chloroflexi bacterium]|nr:hypothetical protein [Chloroflexota bacterium]